MTGNKFTDKLIRLIDKVGKYKAIVMTLAVVVVFVTTYLLILPAFTLEKSEAEKQGGIDLPVTETIEKVDDDLASEDTADNDIENSSSEKPAAAKSSTAQSDKENALDPLKYEGESYNISVVDKEGILPEGTQISVEEIDTKENTEEKKDYYYEDYYKEALSAIKDEEGGEKVRDLAFARFYDITLTSDGKEIEPDEGDTVNVKIEYDKKLRKELGVDDVENVKIIHFTQDVKTRELTAEVLDTKENNILIDTDKKDQLKSAEFDTGSFSVYAIVYTVDSTGEVDGKTYEFDLDGDGFVSIKALAEALDIADDPESFVENIDKVEFSDPKLVWLGEAEEDTTVGALKEKNNIKCEYSEELTANQISDIDKKSVDAGDWVLISLKPFTSEESLAITMKNGNQFIVKITDAQISTNVLTADGETFKITATFDPAANIPSGTELVAEEIKPGSDEYFQYLGRTWAEVNKDYLNQKEQENGPDDVADIRPVNIDRAHFFDVTFVYEGKEIEPNSPVQVDIQLVEGLSNKADDPITGIVHFQKVTDSDEGEEDNTEIELINDFESVKDEDGNTVEYSYKLDSFSVVGAYIGQETEEVGFSPGDPAVTLPKLSSLRVRGSDSGLKELEASKTLTPNTLEDSDQTDGTYTLSLSVKGDAVETEQITKANVLIVMDRSTSMRSEVDGAGVPIPAGSTPEQGKTYYGVVNDETTTLNYDSGTGIWTYTVQEGGTTNTYPYEGTVYVNGTRLNAEQAALEELITALTNKNNQKNPDAIEVSLVSFASERGSKLDGKPTMYDQSQHGTWSGTTETGWETTYGQNDPLYKAVHNNSMNNGTNWEDAMMYAKDLADAKKAAQPSEDVYIIFLTDGMPTAVYGENGDGNNGYGAHHYHNGSTVIGGDYEYAYNFARDGSVNTDYTYLGQDVVARRQSAENGAIPYPTQQIVGAGYKLYTIFTFNKEEEEVGLLRRLTNFAYGNEDTATDTPEIDTYYTNASDIASLKQSFDNIFKDINNLLAHGDVKIVDGLTTDSMTTNIVDGKADGIRYKVEDETGKLAYSVTATGTSEDPKVTFEIGDGNYTYDPDAENNQVRKITKFSEISEQTDTEGKITRTEVITTVTIGGGKTTVVTNTIVSTSTDNGETYTFESDTPGTPVEYDSEDAGVTIPEGAKSYYSVIVGGVEYKMALVDTVTTGTGTTDEKRTLTWDLSPIGALKKDYTYTAELVVWPNQDAYDYVAGLNNGLDGFTWDESIDVAVPDEDNPEYYKGGVKDFPSIVRYDNGDGTYTYSVLTNTEQEVSYSDVYIQNTNDIITSEEKTPHEKDLDPPKPMPLEFTDTFLEKEWSADRNPALLAQVLYKLVGDDIASTGFQALFDIYQGPAYKTDDTVKPYKTLELGWVNDLDDNGEIIYLDEGEDGEYVLEIDPETEKPTGKKIKGHYVWDDESLKTVDFDGHKVEVGTRWSSKFAISTGLMLSDEEHMHDLGLDPDDYPTATYGDKTYYILERGHDYYVEEQAELGYEFDFIAPVFHPMLVDGQLMNVVFEDGFTEGEITPADSYEITDITEAPGGSGNLKVANKLRAYINIEKLVVDKDGVTPLPDDDTKFTYNLDLVSPLNPGPFEGVHIPWYGINGLFYHEYDEQTQTYTYYQAKVTNPDTSDPKMSHTLKLTTESGDVYDAVCTDEQGNEYDDEGQPYLFHEDELGPSWIKYSYEVEGEGDEEPTIVYSEPLCIYGNQMDSESANHVSTTMQIEQGQRLSLANIPQDTRYTITEVSAQPEYDIVNIRKEIMNGSAVESRDVYSGVYTVSGTVVPDRDNNFIFTNKIHSADITVKKIDENGKPLPGAEFTLEGPEGESVVLPAEGEPDLGIYKFTDLADGGYTLKETRAPAGYAVIGNGTTNYGTVSTFRVTNGQITNVVEYNSSKVEWDENTFTFTVTNDEFTKSLTVRKQWLDSDGNLDTPAIDSVSVLLKRKVNYNPPKLTIVAIAQGSNNRSSRLEKTIPIENTSYRVTWPDNGEYQWVANRLTYSVTGGGSSSISIQDGIGANNHGNPSQHGNNYNAIWNLSNLQTVKQDVTITFTYRAGYNGDNYLNTELIFNAMNSGEIALTPIGSEMPPDWTDVPLVLNAENHWAVTKRIGGTDSNHTGFDYPATDDYGHEYQYYIVEETPQGSDSLPGCKPPVYSENNEDGIIEGILTATNKKTERGSLAVQKLVQIAGSANGGLSRADGKYNFTVKDGSGTVIKHVQIRYKNGTATYKVSNSEIPYTDNTGFRRVYVEGAIVDDLIPGTYTVTETEHQLDDPANDMKLVDIKVNGENSFDLSDGTATLAVTAGDVASATTSFTNMVIPLTNVPVNKTWSWSDVDQEHFDNKEIDSWSATFYLQYREVYDSGEPDDPQNVQSLWHYVQEEGSPKQIVISSEDPQGNVADTESETFENLPAYKLHEKDGKIGVYHLKYAVDEVAYTIHYTDGTSSTWTREGQSEAFEEHYSPAYDEDSTQAGESISVINAPSSIREQKTIDLELQKKWEGEDGTVLSEPPDENFTAKFKLRRYYHEEYLEIANSSSINLVKLTLDLGNGKTTELEVPSGAPVYFTADMTPDENTNITLAFRRVSPSEQSTREVIYPNPGHYASTDEVVKFVVSEPVTITDDETWEFIPGESSSADMINAYVLGGIDGVRLATFDNHGNNHGQSHDFPYDVTGEVFDTTYSDTFYLNSTNDWFKNFEKLPQIVERITEAGGHTYLTTTVYSYYFEEIECDPPEYYAVFRDHNNSEVRYGDELSRIEVSGLTIDAINKTNPGTLLYKVDENDTEQSDIEDYLLPGAQFEVIKYTSDEFQQIDNSWGTNGKKSAVLIDNDKDGKFGIDGLVRGFYEIDETELPDGYVRAAERPRFKVVVDPQTEKLVIEALPGNDTLRIVNNYNNTGDNVIIYGNSPGAELPHTGGIGTTIFYILGSILVIGGGIYFVSRRRIK